MLKRQTLLILLVFLTSILKGQQDYDKKSLGIGFNSSAPITYGIGTYPRIPGFATTPYLFYTLKKQEILVGIDIYNSAKIYKKYWADKIYGLKVNYKYYIFKTNRKFNLFALCDIRYVRFGIGAAWPVRYNYLPTDSWKSDYNLIQNYSFINTFGIGFKRTFLKYVGLQFALSGGYNYYQSNYSPTNYYKMGVGYSDVGNKTIPIILTELGLSFKLWKEKNNK